MLFYMNHRTQTPAHWIESNTRHFPPLGNKGASALAEALDLDKNDILTEVAIAMSDALSSNDSLKDIDIHGTRLAMMELLALPKCSQQT
jgi:hypothetical protein